MKYHRDLTSEHWFKLTLETQLANIGSEIARALKWRTKGNFEIAQNALFRSLELFDLALADPKYSTELKEIARARELWLDYFWGDNQYHQTEIMWQKFATSYTYLASHSRQT